MNSHCGICDVEKQCDYEYKPCDCCNYRKFKPKQTPLPTAKVFELARVMAKRKLEEGNVK